MLEQRTKKAQMGEGELKLFSVDWEGFSVANSRQTFRALLPRILG
jgi:hypothetical protein